MENTKNLEIIEDLKTKVADKEKDHSLIKADNKSLENVENKCEYVADSEDEHDLDVHVFSEDCDQPLGCCYCGRNFQTKADLMIHRKQEKGEKVKPFWHISGGGCVLGDEAC